MKLRPPSGLRNRIFISFVTGKPRLRVSACSPQSLWLPSKPAYLVLFLTGANTH